MECSHQGEKLEELIEKAKGSFDNEDYDYRGWFFGTGEDDIPRWAGGGSCVYVSIPVCGATRVPITKFNTLIKVSGSEKYLTNTII